MKTGFPVALLIAVALVSGVRAAQPEAAVQDQRPAKPQPSALPGPPEPRELSSNVQVDVTLADYAGTSAPQKKTVTMVTANGNIARVRAERGREAAVLNVDATPRLQKDGRIVLQISLEYRPQAKAEATDAAPIHEMFTVLLQSGKPLVVTQAADPSSDRKVTVEVTATILK